MLSNLETAMWQTATRSDREWMDAHLTDDFTEFGFSGRAYDRTAILEQPVEQIDIELPLSDLAVRALGRDAALVTYRSIQPRGVAHRTSVWRRDRGRWRLAFHQGTPTGD
jgi:ribonuclease HI